MPITLPNLTVDECPDALGFSTIRVADGSPNGDTAADVIATVYLPEFAPIMAAAPAMLEALQDIARHAKAQADNPEASHRGAWHTVQRIAEKAISEGES
jgi:hypothetical protein